MEGIDCGTNIPMMKALAAINDENDIEQYFVYGNKVRFKCPSKSVADYIKNELLDKDEISYSYRKATPAEIVEHFKDKELFNMKQSVIEKFCQKTKSELGINLNPNTYRRTYAGSWQRSNGAVVWTISGIDGREYGGTSGMGDMLKEWDKVYVWEGFGSYTYKWKFELR